MQKKVHIVCVLLLFTLMTVYITSCTPTSDTRTFAEAHDAFETKLTKQSSDTNEIPAPPEGVFDLVYFDTKAGKLAAYASSDPGDGQKHPIMIWVVGGWGYGIDEFPWTYPAWDNDQTGAAFREAGILMLYPSFRGGNGNPGYYETAFGEIDDLSAAYDYAASLPYVDPDRVYLGGHSTGGTKVLLTSEYTDKFRAVFAFGPVDNIKSHNTSEFTFDTGNQEEYRLRSPIYWLKDIKTPTFIIEGKDGNSSNVSAIEKASENENIHCYIIDGEDHFTILAPITRLTAKKILADTEAEPNITFTKHELMSAMGQPPVEPMPVMRPYRSKELSFSYPAIWEVDEDYGESALSFYSLYDDENFWDASIMFVELYKLDDTLSFEQFEEEVNSGGDNYQAKEASINGQNAYIGEAVVSDSGGERYFSKVAAFQDGDRLALFWFYTPVQYKSPADTMFQQIIGSIELE